VALGIGTAVTTIDRNYDKDIKKQDKTRGL
jgi:hypothetical protein